MDKMYLILNSVKHFSVYSAAEISYKASILGHTFVLSVKFPRGNYLNNGVFLLRNYRLIVAPQKFDVLKTNMLVLRTSNFQGATVRPIVPRHKHSIVFIVHPGVGVIPYMGYIGTCRGIGYGFRGSRFLNRVSFLTHLILCSWCGPWIG